MRAYRASARPLTALKPSVYNPRTADENRLALLELSLRKLGFVLPIVADSQGEILSGHQRHLCATRLGMATAPVVTMPSLPLAKRKAINLLFNRATNDFACNQTCQTSAAAILEQRSELLAIADRLPDVVGHPCLSARMVNAASLFRANADRSNAYSVSVARTLIKMGVVMPIVVDPDGRVVNGGGRLEVLASARAQAPVVQVSADQARFAAAMLNLLTMDFAVERSYGETLRFNSFRRPRLRRKWLGLGFAMAVYPKPNRKKCTLSRPGELEAFLRAMGGRVLDFGAGHGDEARLLRSKGIDVTEFEPYRVEPGTDTPSIELSRSLARLFLERVASGYQWTAVVFASVFNSVPFDADRRHMVVLGSALAPRAFAAMHGTRQPAYIAVKDGRVVGADTSLTRLDYERHVTLGSFHERPKVQRYFEPTEAHSLLSVGWQKVRATAESNAILARAAESRPIDRDTLRAAIEFEFDLPYEDGSRLNLVSEAKAAFSRRFRVDL